MRHFGRLFPIAALSIVGAHIALGAVNTNQLTASLVGKTIHPKFEIAYQVTPASGAAMGHSARTVIHLRTSSVSYEGQESPQALAAKHIAYEVGTAFVVTSIKIEDEDLSLLLSPVAGPQSAPEVRFQIGKNWLPNLTTDAILQILEGWFTIDAGTGNVLATLEVPTKLAKTDRQNISPESTEAARQAKLTQPNENLQQHSPQGIAGTSVASSTESTEKENFAGVYLGESAIDAITRLKGQGYEEGPPVSNQKVLSQEYALNVAEPHVYTHFHGGTYLANNNYCQFGGSTMRMTQYANGNTRGAIDVTLCLTSLGGIIRDGSSFLRLSRVVEIDAEIYDPIRRSIQSYEELGKSRYPSAAVSIDTSDDAFTRAKGYSNYFKTLGSSGVFIQATSRRLYVTIRNMNSTKPLVDSEYKKAADAALEELNKKAPF